MASYSISDVSIALPSLAEIQSVMLLQAGFNAAVVVIGTTLLGVAAGSIGCLALLRNRALMGDALAHSALPGLAAAFIFGSLSGIGGKHMWLLLLGATISGIIGVLCVQLIVRISRIQEDTAIGIVLSCFFGAGVVLLSLIQSLGTGEEGGLHHFIYGQTAAMNRTDAVLTLAAAFVSLAVCLGLLKEFRLVCFDEQFAAADGWPVSRIDLLLMALVVIVTVIGLQAVGLLLVVALLVVPAAAARFWTNRLHRMLLVSACIGGMSGYLGASASALLPRLPAGAVIVLVSGAIFFLSFLCAPARGVIAVFLMQLKTSFRIAEEHFLREIYELKEQRGPLSENADDPIALSEIKHTRLWPWWYRQLMLSLLSSKRLIMRVDINGSPAICLTAEGTIEALRRVRNHRLWEEYLVTHADMPISHVDYSADVVEHVLSPALVTRLETSLADRGVPAPRMPRLPPSIHPLVEERED